MGKTIPVLEIFGPTIQGEGMVIGQKTMFVRTAGCDYSCRWCDSAFTWDGTAKEEIQQMTAEEIWQRLAEIGRDCFSHVTISGGNPALLKSLGGLVRLLKAKGIRVALETQGSRWQDWFYEIDDLTISPKPPSSGMETNFAILDEIMDKLTANGRTVHMSLKVVVFDERDFAYAKHVHQRYRHIPFYLQVGNDDVAGMDEAMLRTKLLNQLRWLVERVAYDPEMNDVRVLPQLHTLLWGNKRGV
ncbi:7-carboxy-7-deazaguanine synthase QueE [Anoxybacillus sp. UARK-01]|jgi:7-carboxy-7-deazaguanine synthase|uniref:7-carboxy-7-deazaguanine synthase n=1 Tax=Anoxybacteroides rupiense TaxID=311460 RepID=A0ABD5IYL2_9BACL|nr:MULTISPECIES: 7-carboxy-7-deazaguanine synthase QueE [Anoxybacillus]MBB3906384.1 7-carboxy-7-deazaguanine synthase [Anoxybacillus rupiensis]MBS2770634.1 7-carboxy-7-deazaguanine synthase QueE [Anoxybacillus rupiensis]MED5053467.1 7-carboxy-7-deazaguanine synthase QueE [Anoxybacillus rupiensis]OQM44222.1 7-carboxy-7-deazaguanine synthase QueE [Anoxybacillus sp. UARK-01]